MYLNGLVSQASDVLHGDPKGAMYGETNGTPGHGIPHSAENADQGDGESLHEFVTAIKQLVHCVPF
jgi:hypothetical protein